MNRSRFRYADRNWRKELIERNRVRAEAQVALRKRVHKARARNRNQYLNNGRHLLGLVIVLALLTIDLFTTGGVL